MKVVVWDLPTRLFHWVLVFSIILAFFSVTSESLLELHASAGYVAFGLVVFRVIWGFCGNRYARFADFLTGPGELAAFVRSALCLKPPTYIGHNPAVGWLTMIIFALLLATGLTGVIVYGGVEFRGIFSGAFDFSFALKVRVLHGLLAKILLAVVAFHISAAIFHVFFLRENVVRTLFIGTKDGPQYRPSSAPLKPRPAARTVALIVLVFTLIFALYYYSVDLSRDYSMLHPSSPYSADGPDRFGGLDAGPVWLDECASSCHEAIHPSLLPRRSWVNVVAGLDDHFGEDLSLDKVDTAEVLKFLTTNSAETRISEVSNNIMLSVKEGEAPLRVTETSFWKDRHSELDKELFLRENIISASNCKGCHLDADSGLFEDMNIYIMP